MPSRLVTVAAFTYPTQAWLAKLRLDEAGIPSFVADENLVSMNWLYSNAVGGVKLQVGDSDAVTAASVLGPEPAASVRAQGKRVAKVPGETCPKCGSPELYWQRYWRRVVFLCWLLLGFPVPIMRRSWACMTCGAWGQRPIQYRLRTLLVITFVVALVLGLIRVFVPEMFVDLTAPAGRPEW
jgi:hypothetical protein